MGTEIVTTKGNGGGVVIHSLDIFGVNDKG